MNTTKRTAKSYGLLWSKNLNAPAVEKWHFNAMQEVINVPIISGQRGIDVGCGCGYDTYIMAKNNPLVEIVSIDLSDGVYNAKRVTASLENAKIVKGSISDMPIKGNIFDFAYSFGVLHHTVNPKKCLREINRVLKKDKLVFLYLYEDHRDNPAKFLALKIISWIRRFTIILPPKIIYSIAWIFSPFVFAFFTLSARILRSFKPTQGMADKIPFNFGRSLFSLQGDLYDRFSAPIEYRYGRQDLFDMLAECGFNQVNCTRLNGISGWVVWGHKL